MIQTKGVGRDYSGSSEAYHFSLAKYFIARF